MSKIKKILISIVLLLVGGGGYVAYDTFGGTFNDRNTITLIGSSSNLVSLPLSGVNANATTTDSGNAANQLADGGFTLQQDIDTSGVRDVLLNIKSIHGTVTSTMHIVQEGSFDGTNFFRIASSTNNLSATTSIAFDAKAFEYDGDITTTTPGIVIPFSTYGYSQTRFIIWGDDLTTDPNDGVQAWVVVTLIRDTAN